MVMAEAMPEGVPAEAMVPPIMRRLLDAADAAIRNQQAALASPGGVLRGITLELEIDHRGAVVESTCYIERRGVHRSRKGD